MKSVAVIGASLAGLSTARALRSLGFDGTLTVVGDEPHLPYDRPPLSKGFLTGTVPRGELDLDDTGLDLRYLTGVAAVGLEPGRVLLADGGRLDVDAVVIATGAAPRSLPGPSVHVLRSVDDAVALRSALVPGARLVVIGGGFIGTEVASTAASLGVSVTVVEAGAVPLVRQLGAEIAGALSFRYAALGIALRCGQPPVRCVDGVEFADGTVLPADAVLVAIGATPRTGWLAGSPVVLDDGVVCDAVGRTSLPDVVAVGDCARWAGVRHEHWTSAIAQASVAAATLLGRAIHVGAPSYVWSDLLGVRLQVAGVLGGDLRPVDGADLRKPESWLGDPAGAAIAVCEGQITGVIAVDSPRAFGRWKRQIGRPVS